MTEGGAVGIYDYPEPSHVSNGKDIASLAKEFGKEKKAPDRYIVQGADQEGRLSPEAQIYQEVLDIACLQSAWANNLGHQSQEFYLHPIARQTNFDIASRFGALNNMALDLVDHYINEDITQAQLTELQNEKEDFIRSLQELGDFSVSWPSSSDSTRDFPIGPGALSIHRNEIGLLMHDLSNRLSSIQGFSEQQTEDAADAIRVKTAFQEIPIISNEFLVLLERGVQPQETTMEDLRTQIQQIITGKNLEGEIGKAGNVKTKDEDKILQMYEESKAKYGEPTARKLADYARQNGMQLFNIDKFLAKNIEVDVQSIPDQLTGISIISNTGVISSVARNVQQNAARSYLALGERDIPAEGLNLVISFGVNPENGNTQIIFADNGKGLRNRDTKRFDFTLKDTAWDQDGKVQGTGNAMAGLASQIQKLGGDLYLRARQDKGRGAEVVLELPSNTHG